MSSYESKKNAASDEKNQARTVREEPCSYEDYAQLDDGNRYELAGGKLELMSPGPSIKHQFVCFELQKRLDRTCGADFIILFAPVDVILSPYEVRQPDLVMIRRDRLSIISLRGVEGPPDLVVEILSPYSAKRDKRDKLVVYARYGIPEYWLVDPENEILEQYVRVGETYQLHDLYHGDDRVSSSNIPCASFTMGDVMSQIPVFRQ